MRRRGPREHSAFCCPRRALPRTVVGRGPGRSKRVLARKAGGSRSSGESPRVRANTRGQLRGPPLVGGPVHYIIRFGHALAIPHHQRNLEISAEPASIPLSKASIVVSQGIQTLCGTRDENLRLLESSLGVSAHISAGSLEIEGDEQQVRRADDIIADYLTLLGEGHRFSNGDMRSFLRVATADPDISFKGLVRNSRRRLCGRKSVTPRSLNQLRYFEAMDHSDMVFGIGPAGTGKTYLAVAYAISALLAKDVRRIVLARPAVEAGEKLGFLPGTLQQKVDPYLRPLYDALHDLLEAERVERNLASGIIEVAPLAFMRGRSLNESFIILDEAQNATAEQMKMFITRLGFGSKAVITGDITQIDLPPGKRSGLIEAIDVLADVKGVRFVHFDEQDVVRHGLVQRIIRAYDRYGSRRWRSAAAAPEQAAEYAPGHDQD
ncbi:MAG: PhoH family protein [Acidobacteriia bacterium]|nr:PhoH family protein [Terriglobia bacterium]MYG00818.1 PhoH family protein [Terriglobia bacterium]MYK10693.1 PhoH family protein [Terriglobia bacterium]